MMRMVATVRTVLVVGVIVAGVPLLLWMVGGNPLPQRLPSMPGVQQWANDPLRWRYLLPALQAVAWLAWSALAGMTVTAALARVRAWRWSRLAAHLPGPFQGLTAAVLGAAAVTTAATAPAHATAPSATDPQRADHDTDHEVSPRKQLRAQRLALTTTAVAPAPAVVSHGATTQAAVTYTVERGDSLSSIARECLGDADRWPEIFALNHGTRFPGVGGTMRDADVIYPGWKLELPTENPPADTATPPTQPEAEPAQSEPSEPATDAHPAPDRTAPDDQAAPPTAATPSDTAASTSPAPVPGTTQGSATPDTGQTPTADSSTTAEATDTDPADPGRPQRDPAGVELPSGSWIDAGLAAALLAAAALVWRHRSRRYTRRPLFAPARAGDPGLTPMPAVITQIRRRLRTALAPTDTPPATATPLPASPPSDAANPCPALHSHDHDDTANTGDTSEAGSDQEADDAATSPHRPKDPAPPPAPAGMVWPATGLGLTGPGAAAAARGLLTTMLATTDPQTPPGHVILTTNTAATLLGPTATPPGSDRLTVTDDLADALDLIEQQILHRSRLCYAHDVDTVAALRTTDPLAEPVAPILLLADPTPDRTQTRIAALLAQGQRLDIHGVLLGAWPTGDTVEVTADGHTTPAGTERHPRHPADIGRLTVLTAAETTAVLTTLTEAHTQNPLLEPLTTSLPDPDDTPDPQPAPAPDGPQPQPDASLILRALADLGDTTAAAIAAHLGIPYPSATAKLVRCQHDGLAETIRTDTGQTLWRLTTTQATTDPSDTTAAPTAPVDAPPGPGLPDTVATTAGQDDTTDRRFTELATALRSADLDTTFTSEHPTSATQIIDRPPPSGRLISVTVLGGAGIVATNPDRRPRRKALELLVYLAVHDGNASAEAILEDLLPDAPASKAAERLYTYVSDLRAVMRRIGGPATYLTHPHRRYVLNPDVIDIDLWRMRTAIRDATHATDPDQRIAALRRAVDAYHGPLADGADYEWAEPYREAIRQQALDAHLALADALTHEPAERARVLEAAIGHSPYSEHLYQQAMQARAELGHLDTIRSLRRSLDRALAEIDAEPSDDTITLADQLIADLQRPRRRTHDISAGSSTG